MEKIKFFKTFQEAEASLTDKDWGWWGGPVCMVDIMQIGKEEFFVVSNPLHSKEFVRGSNGDFPIDEALIKRAREWEKAVSCSEEEEEIKVKCPRCSEGRITIKIKEKRFSTTSNCDCGWELRGDIKRSRANIEVLCGSNLGYLEEAGEGVYFAHEDCDGIPGPIVFIVIDRGEYRLKLVNDW